MGRGARKAALRRAYKTKLGVMYHGLCEDVLAHPSLGRIEGMVQLLFTSPPFALNRKKKYGNKTGQDYIDWLTGYGQMFRRLLTEDGSIVVELGNAWVPGSPTMSTLAMRALLSFQEHAELHLCQEFICFNPARLPSPAQWVTVERIRVKDAFTRVWWMAPSKRPKADNRRVLTEYSESMRKLLQRGTYNAGTRPSEYNINPSAFLTNNGGAIPPNVLVPGRESDEPTLFDILPISNTRAYEPYQIYCRQKGLTAHPARMPAKLVEFFIRFLTDPGDLVLDPFAGSNTTGEVAERLRRRWIGIEANEDYVRGSMARFPALLKATPRTSQV